MPPPLGPAIANTKKSTGIRRIPGDKGYRSHNPPDRFRVWIDGQVRGVSKAIRREMRRRAAIAPKGREGDRMNVAAAGDNFRLKALLRALFATLWRVVCTPRLA